MIRFRRSAYSGEYADRTPPWHILAAPDDWPFRVTRYIPALCGYRYDNIFMQVRFSKAKRKPSGKHCKKCIAAYEKETP